MLAPNLWGTTGSQGRIGQKGRLNSDTFVPEVSANSPRPWRWAGPSEARSLG